MAKKHRVKEHQRKAPVRKPPMPAMNEFTPAQEQAMRMGQRKANMAPQPMPSDNDGDEGGLM